MYPGRGRAFGVDPLVRERLDSRSTSLGTFGAALASHDISEAPSPVETGPSTSGAPGGVSPIRVRTAIAA